MSGFPQDTRLDSTLALMRDGYRFGRRRYARLDTDTFRTRLMLRPAVVTHGAEAAQMFSVPGRFTRRGALPPTTLRLLQDLGSVATLDGAAHHARKRLFLPLLKAQAVSGITQAMLDEWRDRLPRWERMPRVVVHDEVQDILCRAACAWLGIPLTETEARARSTEMAAMIAGAGSVGPRVVRGLRLRRRSEAWAADVIEGVRRGTLHPPAGGMLDILAKADIDRATAVVELLNVVRPTVAVARFITFAALALHRHPQSRLAIRDGAANASGLFAQEVRRLYPFFPFVGGRVLEPFAWRGHDFDAGAWVLFDLYATNHDPRLWDDPESFRPERFRDWSGSPYDFVAQGTGDHEVNHRCPGETLTVALTAAAAKLLATEIAYDVPEDQDLSVDLGTMPALPASGMVIANVQRW